MSKFAVIPILVLITTLASPAQDLVTFEQLTFTSEFEKTVLTDHFVKKDADPFLLFMASGGMLREKDIEAARKRYYDHLATFQNEKVASKRNDKKAKHIYDQIHKTFLTKYEENNQFESIFRQGYFNSVSATALFALAFEELKIPYVIKEEPTHVYLIAYPEQERIKIETTTQLAGVQVVHPTVKQNFVQTLKNQKIISQQEFSSSSLDELFDKYYFGSQNITLHSLVGIQYSNAGISNMDAKNYNAAMVQFEKAYLFLPTEKHAYLLMTASSAALEARTTRDSVHATYVARLSNFNRYGITSEMIVGEFSRAIQDLLFNSAKKNQLDTYYRVLMNGVSHIQLQNELSFLYQYESGRYLFNKARYNDALPYFEAALSLKPEQQDGHNGVLGTLSQMLAGGTNNVEIMTKLETLGAAHAALRDNNLYNNLLSATYLVQFARDFDAGRFPDGEKYRARFEDHIRKYPDTALNTNLVGSAYSNAAVHYFRSGQTSKAKNLIQKGLEYAPNSYELISRQRMIK